MPRGIHPASRANLRSAGGDRTKGKKLVIDAIQTALEAMPEGREIREFFGLRPGQLLKQKHRARWAEVKAPLIYDAMVEAMSGEVALSGDRVKAQWIEAETLSIKLTYEAMGWNSPADLEDMRAEIEEETQKILEMNIPTRYGVLDVGGFLRARAVKTEALYPITSNGNRPVSKSSLEYAWSYFMGAEPGFGELPFRIVPGEMEWYRWSYPVRGEPMLMLCKVPFPGEVNIQTYFEGSGQIEQKKVPILGAKVWAMVVVPPGQNPYFDEAIGEYWYIERIIESYADWIAAHAEMQDYGSTDPSAFAGGLTKSAAERLLIAKPDGWDFEYPVLGAGRGGSVEYVASMFPRKQVVAGVVDPVNGVISYEDVRWVNREAWDVLCGANRGNWLAAGAEVPPEGDEVERRALSITFDSDFIAAIQPDAPEGAP